MYIFSKRRGTEAVITALTRNQLVRVTWHMGSNPILSASSGIHMDFLRNGLQDTTNGFCFRIYC